MSVMAISDKCNPLDREKTGIERQALDAAADILNQQGLESSSQSDSVPTLWPLSSTASSCVEILTDPL